MANEPKQPAPAPEEGQKYIRTFAADMAVAQKGGKPDLVTVEEHDKIVAEAPPPPPLDPIKKEEKPKPKPRETVKPFVWDEEVRAAALERLHAQIAADEAQGIHRSTERSHAIGVSEEAITPLRTYSDDFSTKAKTQGASTFTVLAEEQDKGTHNEKEKVPASPWRNRLYIGGGVFLLLVSVVGAALGYQTYQRAHAPVIVTPAVVAPIFVDEEEEIVGRGSELFNAIVASAARPLASNTVRFIFSTNATTTRDSIFVTAQISAPQKLLRNIIGSASMAGVVNAGGEQAPFFILSVTSYNDTFSSMLDWEASMPRDLAAFYPALPPVMTFEAEVATTTASTTVATTTQAATSTQSFAVFEPGFYDKVVGNHDVRVYRDQEGRTVLLYGYWDERVLVIARNEAAFLEIAGRLANSRTR